MARNSAGLTLGFLGLGEIEEKSALALLDDLIDAVPEEAEVKLIFPLTEGLFTDSLVAIGNHLFEANIPYEVVIDEATAKSKSLGEWLSDSSKSYKVTAVPEKVVGLLEKSEGARLIVLWQDDDGVSEEMTILAQEKGVTVLDIQQGLEEILLQAGEDDPEGGEPEEPAEEGGEEGGEEDEGGYTREELEAIDNIDDLKDILKFNELEMPPPRSKKSTYIAAILAAQGDAAEAAPEPTEEPEAPVVDDEAEVPEEPADEPQRAKPLKPEVVTRNSTYTPTDGETVLLSEEDWEGIRDALDGVVEDVVQQVYSRLDDVRADIKRFSEQLATLGIHVDKALQQGTFAPTKAEDDTPPSTGVRKAAGAVKKAAPAVEAEIRPAVEDDDMSEEEAKVVIEEWGGRRGRPSVEVTKARRKLGLDQPGPKRPVGRPRKEA